jgi:spore germination protein YaaH
VSISLRFLLLLLFAGFILGTCKNSPPPAETTAAEDAVEEITEEAIEDDEEDLIELPPLGDKLPVSMFPEIWGYVVADRESALTRNLPISDVGYFAAEVDSYGSLVSIPARRNLPRYTGRVHMVVKCDGRALTHFVLMPGSAERKALIADLLAASKDFDGLQVDFEYVPTRDREAFWTFLAELRAGLGTKMFTVALPARSRKVADDVYDYERILPMVDRILIMAYDEHWSTSAPGSIASLAWCRRVANYCLGVIGREKLIMGLPFYGRAWGESNPSRAIVYTTTESIIKQFGVTNIRREEGIPTFDYRITIPVKVYYEDEYSLSARMEMYRSMNVRAIGFWRLGQETQEVWRYLRLSSN